MGDARPSRSDRLPDYDLLPRLGDLDIRHAWDVWGSNDRLGTLNLITAATRLGALSLVTQGRCVDLTLPLGHPDPPLYGRNALTHRVFERNRNMIEDELGYLDPQASSQWDSLRHIKAKQHGFYGGIENWDSAEATELGIHQWTKVGIVVRGVLVDLPRYWAARGIEVDPFEERPITAAELAAAAEETGVRLRSGDLLLVRTGWLQRLRQLGGVPDEHRDMPVGVGLEASEEMARMLWNSHVFAVAADNPAVEVLPGDPAVGSLHRRLIPALGMPLGELWDLEHLAEHAEVHRIYEYCVVSVPLHIIGGVASTANAMAIV